MRNKKRLVSAGLALLAALSLALAEEAPLPEITAEPTIEATAELTAEPTIAPEATAAPTIEPSFEPTAEPSSVPSSEPTSAPSAEPTAEPTAEPSAAPTAEPSVPDKFKPEHEKAERVDGVYRIPYAEADEKIAFVWPAVEGADSYRVILAQESADEEGGVTETELYNELQSACRVEFTAETILNGEYILRVRAYAAEEAISTDEIRFTLVQEQDNERPGGFPGGSFPSGGFPSGGFPSGMGGMAGMQGQQQGFQVTPGEALTDDHASGTKDMRLYSAVEITGTTKAVSALALNESGLEITLTDGSFTASLQDGRLSCIPEAGGSAWTLSLRALEALKNSGVDALLLGETELDTGLTLSGRAYGLLRSRGYVSKDFILTIDAAGITVTAAGENYSIDASGALVPFGG